MALNSQETQELLSIELAEANAHKKRQGMLYYMGIKKSEKLQFRKTYVRNFNSKFSKYPVMLEDHIAYRYEITKRSGSGAFAQVLKCFDHKEKRLVAIKLYQNCTQNVQYLKQELKIFNKLKINFENKVTNIVTMLDFFTFRLRPCLVLELLELGLDTVICYYPPLSIQEIKKITLQILVAIKYLHKIDILHGDIKPENIMFSDINKHEVKIIDLGGCVSLHSTCRPCITLVYTAPELLLNLRFGKKTDIWSIGCVAFEMVARDVLFNGFNKYEQLFTIMNVIGEPPVQLLERCTPQDCLCLTKGTVWYEKIKNTSYNMSKEKFEEILEGTGDRNFNSFVWNCLKWRKNDRITVKQALTLLRETQSATPATENAALHFIKKCIPCVFKAA